MLTGAHEQVLTFAVLGSYAWEEKGAPDPHGDRLQKYATFLHRRPEIVGMWIDFPCLPQITDDLNRTDEEDAYFNFTLRSVVNFLYCFLEVCVVMSSDYLSRFWTQFEFYLATKVFDAVDGLIPAVQGPRKRLTVFCIQSLEGQEMAWENVSYLL